MACQVRRRAREIQGPRDVLIKFMCQRSRQMVLKAFRDQPEWKVEGLVLSIFTHLSPITVRKRQELKFFIEQLRNYNISYRWGFPFKLFVEYQGKFIIVKNFQKAKKL